MSEIISDKSRSVATCARFAVDAFFRQSCRANARLGLDGCERLYSFALNDVFAGYCLLIFEDEVRGCADLPAFSESNFDYYSSCLEDVLSNAVFEVDVKGSYERQSRSFTLGVEMGEIDVARNHADDSIPGRGDNNSFCLLYFFLVTIGSSYILTPEAQVNKIFYENEYAVDAVLLRAALGEIGLT